MIETYDPIENKQKTCLFCNKRANVNNDCMDSTCPGYSIEATNKYIKKLQNGKITNAKDIGTSE